MQKEQRIPPPSLPQNSPQETEQSIHREGFSHKAPVVLFRLILTPNTPALSDYNPAWITHPAPKNTPEPAASQNCHSGFGFPTLVTVPSPPDALRLPLSPLPVELVSASVGFAPIATGAKVDGPTCWAGLPTPRNRPCDERRGAPHGSESAAHHARGDWARARGNKEEGSGGGGGQRPLSRARELV